MIVTREMIGAAHDICLKKGDFVLSADLLERIYLAMDALANHAETSGSLIAERDRLAAENKRLREALESLHAACPTSLECESFHHTKFERHFSDEECKPRQRYMNALEQTYAALKEKS